MIEKIEVPGFLFSGMSAGIKKGGEKDFCLIYSESPAVAAGFFTTNKVKAAPVVLSKRRIRQGKGRAIVANSGCANACTGDEGISNARHICRLVADSLDIQKEMVLMCSTGVIGTQLPMENLERQVPELVSLLSRDGLKGASEAIMTTDTYPKWCSRKGVVDGVEVTVAGIAKGVGMICPDMATMLCFLMTDAKIEAPELRETLKGGLPTSFHAISVDGDTSTNDTLLALANGRAGNRPLHPNHPDWDRFASLIQEVMKTLALELVRDGEGASKFIEIRIRGTKRASDAKRLALTVANSPLVKTAIFGEEANWGRIMAAMGRAGPRFDPSMVDIWFNEVQVVEKGLGLGGEREQVATQALKGKDLLVLIDLHGGSEFYSFYTSDLTYDYVKVNASYKS
jgi:glutamate N-acetyltransferase/amino-acid N-acetyltransferase